MEASSGNVFMRGDTLLGVCQALGEDLHFNPNYLRMVFAVGLLWNIAATVAVYLAIGLVVALVHFAVPMPRRSTADAPPAPVAAEDTPDDMAIAA